MLVTMYAGLVVAGWWWERTVPAIGELAELLEEDNGHDSGGEPRVTGFALAVMAGSGTLAVEGAEQVVEGLSVSDTAVGLTLVAFATTAELLALAWAAARRDTSELAVAAIVGSAAYNATVTLGAAALTRPATGLDVRTAALVAAVLPVAILVAGGRRQVLTRIVGGALVAGYVVFVALALT